MRFLLACAVLSGALSAQEETPSPAPTPVPGSLAVPERLAETFARRSPESSEVEAASARLGEWLVELKKHLKALAAGGEVDVPAALEGVRSSGLRIESEGDAALGPGGSVEQGEQVGVRWERAQLPDSARASSALTAELEKLVAPLAPSELRCKTKVTSVRLLEGDERGTGQFGVRLELFGANQARPLQIVQNWTVRFETASPARALEVHLVGSQEVRATAPRFFEDVTASVFEEEPTFARQLLPSLDHWTGRIDQSLGMSLLGHEGFALGDVNGDGLEDLYVLQPGGLPNRLYLHEADHSLRDVSSSAGVDFLDLSHSALIVDLDGDGDRDLAAVISEELLLFSNEGDWSSAGGGRFELKRVLPGLSFFSLSAADFDGDGDLDLYGCAYSLPYWEDSIPIPYHDANNGRSNSLYRNEGEWEFRDATREVGLSQNNSRYSFASAWEDYDQDGDPDLYVANDFGRNNLYRNDGGHFRDVAAEAGVEDISAGMGVDWADVDGDGWMDLLVSNMYSSAGGRIAYQRKFHAEATDETRAQYRRHARGNSLFRNRGDGTFEDISVQAGVVMGRWAWGSIFGDWNSDGAPDIFVPNGFVSGEDEDDL